MKAEHFYKVKSYNKRLRRAIVVRYSYNDGKVERDFEFYFPGLELDVFCMTTADWDEEVKHGPYRLKRIFSPFWKRIL